MSSSSTLFYSITLLAIIKERMDIFALLGMVESFIRYLMYNQGSKMYIKIFLKKKSILLLFYVLIKLYVQMFYFLKYYQNSLQRLLKNF